MSLTHSKPHNTAGLEKLFEMDRQREEPGRTKYCRGLCKQLLPLAAFNRSAAREHPSGRQPYCRACISGYNQAWSQKHRKKSQKRPKEAITSDKNTKIK